MSSKAECHGRASVLARRHEAKIGAAEHGASVGSLANCQSAAECAFTSTFSREYSLPLQERKAQPLGFITQAGQKAVSYSFSAAESMELELSQKDAVKKGGVLEAALLQAQATEAL